MEKSESIAKNTKISKTSVLFCCLLLIMLHMHYFRVWKFPVPMLPWRLNNWNWRITNFKFDLLLILIVNFVRPFFLAPKNFSHAPNLLRDFSNLALLDYNRLCLIFISSDIQIQLVGIVNIHLSRNGCITEKIIKKYLLKENLIYFVFILKSVLFFISSLFRAIKNFHHSVSNYN